jgi:hypothetical protein
MSTTDTASAVIEAVREKLSRVEIDLKSAAIGTAHARVAYESAQSTEAQLSLTRDELVSYLTSKNAEPSTVKPENATEIVGRANRLPLDLGNHRRPLKHEVVEKVKQLLSKTERMRSDEIYEALVEVGVPIAGENGPRRVTQILSDSREFDANKQLGWANKVTQPNPPSATAESFMHPGVFPLKEPNF